MDDPLGTGNFVDWSKHIHHRTSFHLNQSIEQVYGSMLETGIDYAAALDAENNPVGLISYKMLAAALSARYGHELFAKKIIGKTRVPGVLFGPAAKFPPDAKVPIVIPLNETTVLSPELDFFTAQASLERRTVYHSFDDIIVTSADGKFAGMITMRDFMTLQMNVLRWHEMELRRRNEDLNRILAQLSQAQAELLSSAKMAALGELVAGIAHEMNTPLGVLISSHDMIEKVFDLLSTEVTPERRAQLNHHLRTNIDLGREASARVSQIIHSLRIFGRNDQQQQYTANLVDLISSALVLLASNFKASIKVHTNFVESGLVLCYPAQISQVLVNVLTNASQAMKGKGEIFIQLHRSSNRWILTIRDTGPGIPENLMERIFDPGFTTKGVGVGTGLGLSISKKIIEVGHGGRIIASNHPEGGAVFRIELPFVTPQTDEKTQLPEATPEFSSATF